MSHQKTADPKPLWKRALEGREREARARRLEENRSTRRITIVDCRPAGIYCQLCDRAGAMFRDGDGRPLCGVHFRRYLAERRLQQQKSRGARRTFANEALDTALTASLADLAKARPR